MSKGTYFDEIDTSYQCVRNFMNNGTSRRLIRRMDRFVENLKKEKEHESDNARKSVA